MDTLDAALWRAHEIFIEDLSDELDAELEGLLPVLIDAGYVETKDYGDGLTAWGFTPAGVKRGEELGCL